MQKINANKAGLTLGIMGVLLHLLWVILIYLGMAQTILEFVSEMHLIRNQVIVFPFNTGNAAGVVVMSFVVWYIVGYLTAKIWNFLNR